LALAAKLLGYGGVVIANLLDIPVADTQAMNTAGASPEAWERSQRALAVALREGDAVLAAWGVVPLAGEARLHRRAQIEWLVRQAQADGHASAWAVGGQPRHPSRWHQYVSDRHGRTPPGASRPDRLRHVLMSAGWESLRGGSPKARLALLTAADAPSDSTPSH
jgi:hypothetical protein